MIIFPWPPNLKMAYQKDIISSHDSKFERY